MTMAVNNADDDLGGVIDEFEGDEDDDRVALEPLDGHVNILPTSSQGGGDAGSKYAYSAILRDQGQFHCDAIFDFLRDYKPDGEFAQLVVFRLANIVTQLLKAPGSQRMLMYDQAKERADKWEKEIGSVSRKEQLEAAHLWLKRWGKASAVITTTRRRRLQQGMAAVLNKRDKERYYTAKMQKDEIAQRVVEELDPDTLEYFNARVAMYVLLETMDEERAQGYPAADYSKLLTDAGKGRPMEAARLIAELPDFFSKVFTWCIGHASKENAYRDWMQNMIAGVGANGQSSGGRGLFGRRRSPNGQGTQNMDGGDDLE